MRGTIAGPRRSSNTRGRPTFLRTSNHAETAPALEIERRDVAQSQSGRHRQRHGGSPPARTPDRRRGQPKLRDDLAGRGATPGLRSRQSLLPLRGERRRRPRTRLARGVRGCRDRGASRGRGPAHRPRAQTGALLEWSGAPLRQAGAGHRVVPVRAATQRAQRSRLFRLPHGRRPGCHRREGRQRQRRNGHRRGPARPRGGQRPPQSGAGDSRGGIAPLG